MGGCRLGRGVGEASKISSEASHGRTDLGNLRGPGGQGFQADGDEDLMKSF